MSRPVVKKEGVMQRGREPCVGNQERKVARWTPGGELTRDANSQMASVIQMLDQDKEGLLSALLYFAFNLLECRV